MTTIEAHEMTARQHTILAKMCFWKDTRTTYSAAMLVESTGMKPATVLANLQTLRAAEFVRYYPGHPGLWEATPRGRREIGR